MQGYPEHINSRQDFINLLAMPEYAARARADLQWLLEASFIWANQGQLNDGEVGSTDATHQVLVEDMDDKTIRSQLELVEDPKVLGRLGLTIAEAQEWLAEGVK